ncbi:hypothetical protein LguiA_007415 [Lonicera macranthoides]
MAAESRVSDQESKVKATKTSIICNSLAIAFAFSALTSLNSGLRKYSNQLQGFYSWPWLHSMHWEVVGSS